MIRKIGALVNALLRPAGVQLVRRQASPDHRRHVRAYVSARATVQAARTSGLSVSNYLEQLWNEPGVTQTVIDEMQRRGVFDARVATVCEIGTGSGKFLEKVVERERPEQYDSYEPDRDWADWLQQEYAITSQACDGYSLRSTATGSVDLVHAHGVFVYLPFLTTCRYFREIARVAGDRGFVVFDIISERCLDEVTLSNWLSSDHEFPVMLPRQYVVDVFQSAGFLLVGEFFSRLAAGRSHYLVFRREGPLREAGPQ